MGFSYLRGCKAICIGSSAAPAAEQERALRKLNIFVFDPRAANLFVVRRHCL